MKTLLALTGAVLAAMWFTVYRIARGIARLREEQPCDHLDCHVPDCIHLLFGWGCDCGCGVQSK